MTASEPKRPADDIDRRPDVPAGVGQTINMCSGEARESHLAGIAAHGGGSGVLNPSPCYSSRVERRQGLPKPSSTIFF